MESTGRRNGLRPTEIAVAIAGVIVLVLALVFSGAEPLDYLLLAGLPVVGFGFFIIWRALSGDRGMIMFVLLVTVFVVDAVFRVRSYDDKSIDFQILMKAGTWALLFALALARAETMLTTLFTGERIWWAVFFGWLIISTFYAPNPLYSLVAVFSAVSFLCFFAAISRRYSLEQILVTLLFAIVLMAIASLVVYFAVPALGRTKVWIGNYQVISNRLAGLAGNANSIGRICGIGLIITAIYWRNLRHHGRLFPHAIFILLSGCLLLSNSRTSILVTMVVLAIYFLGRARNIHLLVMGLALFFVALLALAPFSDAILVALSRSGRADELATGTSRTLIWHVVGLLGWQKPLLGWGYGSSVFIMPQYSTLMGHAAPHAHNMILQLWLTTGAVGVCLFLLAFTARLITASLRGERIIVALLLFVMLNGISESSAFSGVANIATIILALAAMVREHPPNMRSEAT